VREKLGFNLRDAHARMRADYRAQELGARTGHPHDEQGSIERGCRAGWIVPHPANYDASSFFLPRSRNRVFRPNRRTGYKTRERPLCLKIVALNLLNRPELLLSRASMFMQSAPW